MGIIKIINMRSNALSMFGRMSHGMVTMTYPAFFAFVYFGAIPWYNNSCEVAKKEEWDNMIKKKVVDPDLFQPFSPIPFHNSQQAHYGLAHISMLNYVDSSIHINTNDYVWKSFHDSYDHCNKKVHYYNWTSYDHLDHSVC